MARTIEPVTSDFGQLKGDGTGVAHDAGPDLDQLELKARQRSVDHDLGQIDAGVGPSLARWTRVLVRLTVPTPAQWDLRMPTEGVIQTD